MDRYTKRNRFTPIYHPPTHTHCQNTHTHTYTHTYAKRAYQRGWNVDRALLTVWPLSPPPPGTRDRTELSTAAAPPRRMVVVRIIVAKKKEKKRRGHTGVALSFSLSGVHTLSLACSCDGCNTTTNTRFTRTYSAVCRSRCNELCSVNMIFKNIFL